MEITSPKHEARDYKTKRADYASAGIPEYWIIDLKKKRIAILKLSGTKYVTHKVFKPGQHATSVLIKNFCVDVSAALKGD